MGGAMNKTVKRTVKEDAGRKPVTSAHTGVIALADIEETIQTQDGVRAQYQTYLDARTRHGVMPLLLIVTGEDGGEYTLFENDVYTAAQYVPVRILPGLHHSAIINPSAVAKLQAAGHQIIYVNGGQSNERQSV
jgi:hypothetical protein